jgi:hypothetical protein
VKGLIALPFLVGCATSPEAPTSSATLSGAPTVVHARVDHGVVNYGGALLTRWTVALSPTEGCVSEAAASIEINSLSSMTALAAGTVPLRAAQMTVDTLPSAFLTYQDATLTSGTVTIDSATESFVAGSLSAQVTLAGAPTALTATFSSPVCAAP